MNGSVFFKGQVYEWDRVRNTGSHTRTKITRYPPPTPEMDVYINGIYQYLSCAMRKRVFGHMHTEKAQISLRIRAVWSGPLLSTNKSIGYYRIYEWRAKPGWYFVHVQDDLNPRIFRMFEGTWMRRLIWALIFPVHGIRPLFLRWKFMCTCIVLTYGSTRQLFTHKAL